MTADRNSLAAVGATTVAADGKRKKPPACDRCKAKRVLCHPNPAGCPRCREKGLDCITTPPARRGRPRKNESAPSSRQRSEQPAPAAVSSGFVPELPCPPPLDGGDIAVSSFGSASTWTTTSNGASRPAQILDLSPSVLGSYASFDPPLDVLQGPVFRPDASTSTAMAWQSIPCLSGEIDSLARRVSTGLPNLNPELVRHLYDAFRQSPHFDEGLSPFSSLLPSLSSTWCSWQIDLLPRETQALAYACLSIGVLYSYDPSIIGVSPFMSFASLPQDRDLREYGRRRRPAFEEMRDLALRAAKETDVWMEPTIDNAAACNMLDLITRKDELLTLDSRQTRPFLRSYTSHLTHLVSHGAVRPAVPLNLEAADVSHLVSNDAIPKSADYGPAIRTIHLAGAVCAEIGRGTITASQEDQDIISETTERPSVRRVEQQYRIALAAPVRDQWPEAHTICLLYIATARTLVNEVLAPHRRRAPVDVAALMRNFEAILALQSVSRLHTQVWDRIIARTAASSTDVQAQDQIRSSVLFPHIARRRVRWTRLLAAQAVGRFGAFVWATLVVPFVTEVTRRASNASTMRPDEPFKAQHDRVQLEMLLQQSRALVPHAVEAQVKLWERSPSLALLALTRPIGLVETFEQWIDLVEAGHLVGVPHLAKSASKALRLGGWVHSSMRIDRLIDRLDAVSGHQGMDSDSVAIEAESVRLFEMLGSPGVAPNANSQPDPLDLEALLANAVASTEARSQASSLPISTDYTEATLALGGLGMAGLSDPFATGATLSASDAPPLSAWSCAWPDPSLPL